MKQKTSETSILKETSNGQWIVTIKPIKNDINGNPRKEARITLLQWNADEKYTYNSRVTNVFILKGYASDSQFAEELIIKRERLLIENEKNYWFNKLQGKLGNREKNIIETLETINRNGNVIRFTNKEGYSFEYSEDKKAITN